MSQNLNLTNLEILQGLSLAAGLARDQDWDSNTFQDFRNIIRSGLRKFFMPQTGDVVHQWRFLERHLAFAASDAVSTGTVAVSGGVVTLTGDVWPSWADDGVIDVGGQRLFVDNVTATTTLTITNTAIEVAAGTTFTMYRWRYGLPTDFGEMIGGLNYGVSTDRGRPLSSTSEEEIILRYTLGGLNSSTGPRRYSVQTGIDASTATEISPWYASFWQPLESGSFVSGIYRSIPLDKLDASDLTADGSIVQIPAQHAETLLEAILSVAEEHYDGVPGAHAQRYAERLATSIALDRRTPAITSLQTEADEGTPFDIGHNITFTYES